MEIGTIIKDRRNKCEMTQKELAKKLHISEDAIHNYEKGKNNVPAYLIKDICLVLHISPLDLLGIDKKDENKPHVIQKYVALSPIVETISMMSKFEKDEIMEVIEDVEKEYFENIRDFGINNILESKKKYDKRYASWSKRELFKNLAEIKLKEGSLFHEYTIYGNDYSYLTKLVKKAEEHSSLQVIHQTTFRPSSPTPSVNKESKYSVLSQAFKKPPKNKKELDYLSKWRALTDSQKEDIIAKVTNATKSIDFTAKHLRFLKVMGNTGLYQMKDILAQDDILLSNGYNIKMKLIESGIVSELEEVKAGSRSFKPIMLSDMGNWLYFFQYKKNPCESIYKRLIAEQKSPQHGVIIKSIVKILSEAGYSCTQEDVKQTPSGRDTICDILAHKQKTDFRIEYEEGNYSKENYLDKFSRIWEVTPYLIVIVPNEEVKVKISSYIQETVALKFKGIKTMKDNGYQYLVETINSLKNNPSIISNLVNQNLSKKSSQDNSKI